jgi:hypothetical protein
MFTFGLRAARCRTRVLSEASSAAVEGMNGFAQDKLRAASGGDFLVSIAAIAA